MGIVEGKLRSFGYRKSKGNTWINGNRTVHVQHSKQCSRDAFRILWAEEWKDYYALIIDYSAVDGPICIVPGNVFFNSNFVAEKRGEDSYANSGYTWSQPFPIDHELTSLILKYKDRWDIIESIGTENPNQIMQKPEAGKSSVKHLVEPQAIDVIVDGSNVAYDNVPKGQPPRFCNILMTLDFYQRKKLNCRVIVDAALRWKIDNRDEFCKAIDEKLIYQAPPGVRADEYILKLALSHPKSKIVSNDEFRDWLENVNFKEIKRERLIKFKINGEFIEFSRMGI